MPIDTLKIAVLGCGAIADAHAWAIQQIAGCRMVAACDSEELMAKLFCERFKVPAAFVSLDEMLKQAQPDVVHILTPPQSHYATARQCLERGCHVYVEKPLTLRVNEAEELFKLSVEKNLKLTVGHDAQFSPATRELRKMIQSGYLGGPAVHMESYYGYEFGNLYGNAVLGDKQHWVRRLPGKLLQNVINHGIARIAEFLPGEKPQVIVHGFVSPALRKIGEDEIVDELRVIISDETGATAYFTFSSQMRPSLNQFRIYGPQNGLALDETQQTVIRLRGEKYKSYAEKFVPPLNFARQYLGNFTRNLRLFRSHNFHMEMGKKFLAESFYHSIKNSVPAPIPVKQIWMTTWLMDQIFEQITVAKPRPALPSVPQFSPQISVNSHSVKRKPAINGVGLIINADDWGRSRHETDRALACYQKGRITSVSAMVFMKDSERAAELAREYNLDVGLHLNLGENFSGTGMTDKHARQHARIVRFLNSNKYALVLYHPFLRKQFRHDYEAQMEEFLRLYGKPPTHVDGHKHNHLCTNMLVGRIIPDGAKVRRTFSFAAGERSRLNLAYRNLVQKSIARRYELTDYFFSLYYSLKHEQMSRVADLAKKARVEIAAHPENGLEYDFLMGDDFEAKLNGVQLAAFSQA